MLIQFYDAVRVGRQVEELDLIGMVLHPGGDPAGAMDRQIVDDHEQLACRFADQAAQEIEKDRRLEGTLIDHEAQLALIGQARNHRLRKALARSPDDRGVSSGGKAAAVIGPTGQAGLVGPLDVTALRLGLASDRRIGVHQPRPDRFVLPLGGPAHRPLGGEAPAP
jgi:hypothetical protein